MMTDPPMSLGVFLRVHSFVRSIHKAEAGDAPLWTQLNSFNGRMVKIMPASPCHPLVFDFCWWRFRQPFEDGRNRSSFGVR